MIPRYWRGDVVLFEYFLISNISEKVAPLAILVLKQHYTTKQRYIYIYTHTVKI